MKIIGLAGRARSGKDTVADYFVAQGYKRLSFADRLKDVVASTFNHDIKEYYSDKKENRYSNPLILTAANLTKFIDNVSHHFPVDTTHGGSLDKILALSGREIMSHRQLLQVMGTDIGRKLIDPEIWTTIYINEAKKFGKVITPDARFHNERRLIESLGGRNIFIHRPGTSIEESAHISENELGEVHEYDHVICNEGTLDQLKEKVELIIMENE